ncbi:MAG: isoprenylcysteine carboxylmethyltransferase family protein [Thermodesulfobacteriota bacterium]
MPDYDTFMRLSLVALIWVGWCVQHSLLNSDGLMGRTGILKSSIGPYYRPMYNTAAVVTLIAASKLTPRANELSIIEWQGWWKLVPVVVWTGGFFVFWLTARLLDGWAFLGLRALGVGSKKKRDSEGDLITWGIYGIVRHPQFAAGIVMLWARDLHDTDIVISIVLCAYLLIGARIEESRLVRKFGEKYLKYREEVPPFIPTQIPRFRKLIRSSPPRS